MSIPSEITFHLEPSKDYLKLSILVNGFALGCLWLSSLPLFLKVLLMLGVGICAFFLHQKERQMKLSIHYQMQRWKIDDAINEPEYFDALKIQMDCAFFIILRLNKFKVLVLFKDQLKKEAYKLFYILLKSDT